MPNLRPRARPACSGVDFAMLPAPGTLQASSKNGPLLPGHRDLIGECPLSQAANPLADPVNFRYHASVIQDSEEGTHLERTGGLFPPTHWSVVLSAKAESSTALSALCLAYRQPMLVWVRNQLRGWGRPDNDAEDLVHGCLENLLRRDFLKDVAREKGRFRTFLLSCLKNYLRDQHEKRTARKRGGCQEVQSLDQTGEDGHPIHLPADSGPAPDREYDRAWAQAVLANAVRRLATECASQGNEDLFRALEPSIFCDETASPYREVGVALGMSEAAVKTAAHRLRTRLKGLIRDEILQTVTKSEDWEAEIRYLIELFGSSS